MALHPQTPDGRYFVVRGRLWRTTNPSLSTEERQLWVKRLMTARRAKGLAKKAGDLAAQRHARSAVEEAKRALGERGPVWWHDGAPDWNRHMVTSSPYKDWYKGLGVGP